MKSIEELIDKLLDCCVSYDGDDEYIPFGERQGIKAEILSRFAELETEKDFLDLCFKQKNKDLLNAESAYSELEQRYMNLKQRAEQAKDKDEAVKKEVKKLEGES